MASNLILKKILANINEYFLVFLALIIIFGAGIYYLYALNWLGVILSLVLSVAGFVALVLGLSKKQELPAETYKLGSWKNYIYLLIYLFLAGASFHYLLASQSTKALISPWQVTSGRFFIAYLLSSAVLIFILSRKNIDAGYKIILLSLHYFLSFSVAIIVYKIGYGFDPFIHQATMSLIDSKGLVLPKPPYYLGEYSLIIIFHKISGLSIYLLNKFLVPLLAALFLPLAAYRFLKRADAEAGDNHSLSEFLTVLFLLALTFSPFIVTTPQNLTYLFLILTIFVGLAGQSAWIVLILALSTTAIHPLSGLPALAWSAYLFLHEYQDRITKLTRQTITALIFIANALALPFALFISGGGNLKQLNHDLSFLITPFKNLFTSLGAAGREDWLSNALYFLANNYNLLLILIIFASLIYFYTSSRRATRSWRENGLILINSSLIIAYILSSQIRFHDLINYEQNSYASRILVIILLFFLPFVIEALNRLIKKIITLDLLSRIIWLAFGVALLSAALYLSYPRFDKYFNSRGYSTGQNDLAAVNLIASEASKPYIVLANQQVSAAALDQLGFDHYYETSSGPIYFYPIPTGGLLYQYYLAMVYQSPNRATMKEAMTLAGVNESYLVVNKYWFQSDRVIGLAKLTADSYQSINNDIYIFKYKR